VPEILPSVRFTADDPRPVGFVDEVSEDHLSAAESALCEVADAVADVSGRAEPGLSIRFSSVRFMPGLPFVLYGFHIQSIDDAGVFSGAVAAGDEVIYALVANHAVEVQRETAVLFLYDIVFRQIAVADIKRPDGPPIGEIDSVVSAADDASHREFADRMREGWRHAVRSISQRALAAGIALSVRYEVDVLPSRSDVVRRMPILRRTYNEIAGARQAIDNIVAMVGGRDPRLSASGIPVAIENKLQRQLSSLNIRQWVSQTTRDAEVCGNGYLAFTSSAEPALYNLRPEDVDILGSDEFSVMQDGVSQRVADHVLHVRGIEQFRSPYGISILEPVLNHYQSQLVIAEALQAAERFLAERPEHTQIRTWAAETRALAARTDAASDDRLSLLLSFPREQLPEAREGLYFAGQERM
jgi:hypothetical protein